MSFNSMKLLPVGLVVALALGFAASRGHSEITVTDSQKPVAGSLAGEGKGATSEVLKQSAALWVQCWQHGVKIIDEKDVYGIRLQNLIERDSVGFKGRNSNNGDIYVIPVNDNSTCLVKPLR